MPVDPSFTEFLANRRNELRPPSSRVSIDDLRQGATSIMIKAPSRPVHSVEDRAIDGPGGALPLRLYRSSAATAVPLIVYLHGGGFVLGGLDSHDSICSELALRSGAIVLSVDYRLAPEARHPGPVEDCHAALHWAASNAVALGAEPSRLAIAGDSSGGNLAVATALLARARGPSLTALGLLYPMTDASCESASMSEFSRGYILTRDAIRWFWHSYLPAEAYATDPLISVLRADLSGLPPTSIITAEFDPLRDEGEALATNLRLAGVQTTARRYLGMIHGFAGMSHLTRMAARALNDLARDLTDP